MGVRITPPERMAVQNSNTFYMQATSAETNVLNVASSLGRECLVLTKFVKDSPVARMIKDNLAGRHMDYEGPEIEQGGPWGYRHQFNLADSGYGSRGGSVTTGFSGTVARPTHPKTAISAAAKPAAGKPTLQLSAGDQVNHKTFGDGMVISVTPMGGDALIEVAFEQVGTKKLMLKTAGVHMTKK